MSDYYPRFENHVGKPVTDLIMSYVRTYKLKEEHAEEFARHLDEQLNDEDDRKVKGNFMHAKTKNGYNYGPKTMQCILSDWFEGYENTNKQETIRSIISALKSAKVKPLASDIERLLTEEKNVQTVGTSGGNDDHVVSNPLPNKTTENAERLGKVINGLPNTPVIIPLQKPHAAGPTSSEPYPSKQHGPVCASHAIGKAILKILDLCNFDGSQEKIIDALIREVQPNQEARNPDEFHGKTIMVNIEDGEKKIHDVKLCVDVQTDLETEPILTEKYLNVKKIQRVIRDNTANAHALYVKGYDGKNYNCINSWGPIDPFPVCSTSVYAVDYIQITEI